jgi:hypothetical protein
MATALLLGAVVIAWFILFVVALVAAVLLPLDPQAARRG